MHAGARVRFIDADPTTFALNVESLKENLTDQTAAVIVVHIGGMVTPEMPEIQRLCSDRNVFLFEDAAHAHGSSLNGRRAGTFGNAASFSFYPTKVLTSAEGGMIVTNDAKLKTEAMLFRDQGKISFLQNEHDKLGYNWRMSEPHAIIGCVHFKRLDFFIAERRRLAREYDEALAGIPKIASLSEPIGCTSNYYKYIIMLEPGIDRTRLKLHMREEFGVGLSGEVYEIPCHLQPFWRGAYPVGAYPVAEDICRRHICLPLFQGMTKDQVRYVTDSIGKSLAIF